MSKQIFEDFLGNWSLDPESCVYEQSEPPREATHRISLEGESLHFTIHSINSAGETHLVSFSGVPDGRAEPFNGGELADALAVQCRSERELITTAFFEGEEIMVSQRQLDQTMRAMRVTQIVRFPDGNSVSNVGVYRKNSQAS